MEITQETEDYIRGTIDHTVGLQVPTGTLLQKLRAVGESRDVLQHQNLCLQSKLKEKDKTIERSRAEASMSAAALKKFVEENQKLAVECSNLLEACKNWERECALYDKDREAILDFANEADERAREAEARNLNLEEQKKKLEEDLQYYKIRSDGLMVDVVSGEDPDEENNLLNSLLATVCGNDEITSTAHRFLESHSGVEACQELLRKWPILSPLTQKIIALTANAKSFQKDRDLLTMNLRRSEEEVNALVLQNNVLNEENKRLIRKYYRDKHVGASGGGSSSGKGKRKSSHDLRSPSEKKMNTSNADSQRQPLSPLKCNSPELRVCKK
ncbi:uncharacterized protein LOC127242678 [Andrographis paniculata]|uniref:uncharacterized protein LOC127242678 n=1 Tax=Andrographis paniculata TaxID=175694 RepID=UPI0021E94D75|nr:uncharacterized protein LOC127242678 [Andrographis paniculata]